MSGKACNSSPGSRIRLITFSQRAQFGSMSKFTPGAWSKKEAWPIQVSATCPDFNSGNSGVRRSPVRRSNKLGQTTSERKLRRCQPTRGFSPT